MLISSAQCPTFNITGAVMLSKWIRVDKKTEFMLEIHKIIIQELQFPVWPFRIL